MLLLIGYSSEATFQHFANYVTQQGVDAQVLDLCDLLTCSQLHLEEEPFDLIIASEKRIFRLSAFSAIYCRYYYTEIGAPRRNEALSKLIGVLTAYLDRCPQTVINRPSAGVSNINKFRHGALLSKSGFTTPTTHILGDHETALNILAPDGNWVSKSCSSAKTKVVLFDEYLMNRLPRLKICPSLFQTRTVGPDVRVHIVGQSLFPEKIISQRIDYRFIDATLAPNQYSECDIPPIVAEQCLTFCKDEKLLFSGIDFKVSEVTGEWHVLEANPMPGYESYDRRQNFRISNSLLQLLLS